MNCRNSYISDNENLHATQPRGFQEQFGINVWAGIIDGHLIGPYILPYHLTDPRYFARSTGRVIGRFATGTMTAHVVPT